MKYLQKCNVLAGDWFDTPIAPKEVDAEKVGYKSGVCPVAEATSKKMLNLPTHINVRKQDAERIVKLINDRYGI
jgi:dTDP-4-amino-4,6-dideoxygalactose transaminase